MLPDLLVKLLVAVLYVLVRLQYYPLLKLYGYKRYDPLPDSVVVSCCTNGLGHIHQMERVLSVLEAEGVKFPVIALAKERKVPAYKLSALKERFPSTKFVNLDFEVDYDSGKAFETGRVLWSAFRTSATRSTQLVRKVTRLLKKHRPAYVLSFWEPSIATLVDITNGPANVVSVASQGQIYADAKGTGVERGLLMRGLHLLNVGRRGTLVPLSVMPMDGAIPQVVKVPTAQRSQPYFVAYTTVPQVHGSAPSHGSFIHGSAPSLR